MIDLITLSNSLFGTEYLAGTCYNLITLIRSFSIVLKENVKHLMPKANDAHSGDIISASNG